MSALAKRKGSPAGVRGPRQTLDPMRVLAFVTDYLKRSGGVSPSQDEIAVAFGLKCRGCRTHTALKRLEDLGFIRQLHGSRRAIEVLRAPIPIYDAATHQIRGYVS